ncbi:putative sugar nucleotidyl transferase [Calycomorphotria hydatis]|uniref:Bacterial transferase hexapeptide (Six repeats) n=1 Tax=Calycomorphotria hydatis TaxID=2528027 RepID=A0A517T7B5_9PLAN|nr:putative sugar nucleotidyl transferase [Calycomorphotria hydatis]QDT64259.1 hypothetical protein V22_14900 [Calycomorphotria hydatis]
MTRIAFFEDALVTGLEPLTFLRPAFELRCGRYTSRERLVSADAQEFGAFTRPALAESYAEEHPQARINDFDWLRADETLLINGRWLSDLTELTPSDGQVGLIGDEVAWIAVTPEVMASWSLETLHEDLLRASQKCERVKADGVMLAHPWDLVERNSKQLEIDFRSAPEPKAEQESFRSVEILGDATQVRIDPTATINPFVVLDATSGPITIAADAVVDSFTKIEGPAHIGAGSQLFRALIRSGTTIGPVCRVGGEIEASIFHGYSNKYHEGFFGHGYICPWVNLGAMTTNSDLRNDYGPVSVPLSGIPIQSGQNKVGTFIGDHTKTALASLFNTGTSVGVMSMVVPGAGLLPKHIPSFSRVWHGVVDDKLDLESALDTAAMAMSRRDCEMTDAMRTLLRSVHAETECERQIAIERAAKRG